MAGLNNLDEELCGAFGLAGSADAADLDEAITMSAAPIALETARSLFQKAARKSDDHDAPEPEAAMAKVSGSRVAVDIARDAIPVHGSDAGCRSPKPVSRLPLSRRSLVS